MSNFFLQSKYIDFEFKAVFVLLFEIKDWILSYANNLLASRNLRLQWKQNMNETEYHFHFLRFFYFHFEIFVSNWNYFLKFYINKVSRIRSIQFYLIKAILVDEFDRRAPIWMFFDRLKMI